MWYFGKFVVVRWWFLIVTEIDKILKREEVDDSVRREASYSHWVGVQYGPTDAKLNSY